MCFLKKQNKNSLPQLSAIMEQNKPERLGAKFIVITGKQRVGKTSLGCAMLVNNYRYYNDEIVLEAQEKAQKLETKYGYNLPIANHVFFSSSEFILSFEHKAKTWFIDIPRFALPNEQFKVQYFPYSSVIHIAEADVLLNCRDYKGLNMYLLWLLKYFGHMNLTIIFDCQSYTRLDKAVIELITDLIFVYKRETEDISFMRKNKQVDTKKYTWYYLRIDFQTLRMQQEFKGFVKNELDLDPVIKESYTFIGDIHRFYKSNSATPYFYYNLKNKTYEYIPHIRSLLDPVSVKKYCELHPLVRPEDIKKAK